MANDATPSPDTTPSPAETLRRAAAELRNNAARDGLDDFGFAVAEWLDLQALDFGWMGTSNTDRAALTVARAILGESA